MNTDAKRKLVIAAGGTGGHMFPAQALGEALMDEGWEVIMMTDARGRRHVKWLPDAKVHEVEATSISPRQPLKALRGLVILGRGTAQAKAILRDFRPDAVAGFGGYPAFPALRAAKAMGIPYILHEQNTVLGRVNRLFAKGARAVATGFDTAQRLAPGSRHVATGNPLRQQILDAIPDAYTPPGPGEIRLLIVGGSLGARIIAQTVPKAIALLPQDLRHRLSVVQQTTEGELDRARQQYEAAGVKAKLATFFSDIQTHLARAHLVIGRAGASSVSEFAAMGVPTVLVPLAIAMDDHQTVNASTLSGPGAAIVLPESAFTPEALARVLEERLADDTWLESAARAARATAKPDATARLVELVKSLVR